jgi:hypothetical protein
MFDRRMLIAAGLGVAAGAQHHGLATTGRTIAGLCAHDAPTATIEEAVKQLKA